MRNKNGITLIVLVITIIVLLILAGISLSLVLGDNGIIEKSQKATTATRNAEEMEKIRLEVLVSYDNNRNLDFEKLKSNISAHITEATADGTEFPLTVTYVITRNVYKVNSNGDIDLDGQIIKDANAEEKEKVERAMAAARAAGNGVLTTENLNTELDKVFNNGKQVEASKVRRLPVEYQEVEYIEGTGTQYINTNVQPSGGKYTVNIDFQLVENIQNTWIFGIDLLECGIYDGFYTGTGFNYSQNTNMLARTIANVNRNITNNKKFLLFARDFNSTETEYRPAKVKIYSTEILENEESIRNFIPCYSTTTVTDVNGKQCPSGTKGLYDLVEGKFYTNQNSSGADFTAGKKIETTETLQWEYKLDANRKYVIYNDGKVEYENQDKGLILYNNGDTCNSITGGWEEWSGVEIIPIHQI